MKNRTQKEPKLEYTIILMGIEGAPEIKWVECPSCEGTGKINGAKCSSCDGRGKVRA